MKSSRSVFKATDIDKTAESVLIPDMPVSPVHEEPLDGETPQQMYERLIAKAQEDGEALSQKMLTFARTEREVILDQAQKEAEKLKEQIRQEAYASARVEKAAEMEAAIARMHEVLDDMMRSQWEFWETYRASVGALAIDIASKILCHAIEEDPRRMQELVVQAVASVRDAQWISVQVSQRLPGLAGQLEKEIARRKFGVRVEVSASDLDEGSCLVETPDGVIDASIQEQLENLRELFAQVDWGLRTTVE